MLLSIPTSTIKGLKHSLFSKPHSTTSSTYNCKRHHGWPDLFPRRGRTSRCDVGWICGTSALDNITTKLTSVRDWEKSITVRVGPTSDHSTAKNFTVHEDKIRLQSPFFEAALGREWKEAEERLVSLPEHEPDAFRLYLGWLYQKKIFVASVSLEKKLECVILRGLLCHGYLLGVYIQDDDFQDAMMDAIIHITVSAGYFFASDLKSLYTCTLDPSPIRRFMIDTIIYASGDTIVQVQDRIRTTDLGEEALRDIICAQMDLKASDTSSWLQAPFFKDTCHYHVHGAEKPCYKIKYKITGVAKYTLPWTSPDGPNPLEGQLEHVSYSGKYIPETSLNHLANLIAEELFWGIGTTQYTTSQQ